VFQDGLIVLEEKLVKGIQLIYQRVLSHPALRKDPNKIKKTGRTPTAESVHQRPKKA
jgi:hypothetical protein